MQNSQDKRNDSASLPFALPDLEPGWVWLAGAGPGDPGLLTLHTWQGLQQAEVVVYDALVDERILKLASPECKLEYAGKRGGKPSPKQAEITERVIHLARQHKRVLRLRGGDPFVFGRGGQEKNGGGGGQGKFLSTLGGTRKIFDYPGRGKETL